MQNSSPNQMMMLLTRVGKDSKMVITGDLAQSDKSVDNGLKDFINKYKLYDRKTNFSLSLSPSKDNIRLVELNSTDIMRSIIVDKIIQIYDFNKNYVVSDEVIKKVNLNNCINEAALIPKNHLYTKNQLYPK